MYMIVVSSIDKAVKVGTSVYNNHLLLFIEFWESAGNL